MASFLKKVTASETEKCLVCNKPIKESELKKVAKEFKPFPAHKECFDSFDTAEDFLKFAKKKKK